MNTGIVEWLRRQGPAEWQMWPDYLATGVNPADADGLIEFLAAWHRSVDEDSDIDWVAVHGWRCLGQLRSEKALPVLIDVLDTAAWEPWVCEELPIVFSLIGPAGMDPLIAYLNDRSQGPLPRAVAGHALAMLAEKLPELRRRSVGAISDTLRGYASEDPDLNSLLIWHLADLKERPAIPLIKEVFAAEATGEGWGDVEDVLVRLGVLLARKSPRKKRKRKRKWNGEWDWEGDLGL